MRARDCHPRRVLSVAAAGLGLWCAALAGCGNGTPARPETEEADPSPGDAGGALGAIAGAAETDEGDPGNADAGFAAGEDPPDAGPWSGGVEWILLLGFDDWGRLPGRTDAILLAAFRHGTGDIALVSVPRDLWVDIPGWEPGRINKVYRVGEMLHGRGGGNRLLKKVIRAELGVSIHHTVTADFEGFRQVVDLLGGIHVDVACPIRDNFIDPDAPAGWDRLELAAGRQRLDGRTALLYSRSRHGRTDMDRARRQQAVLTGLKRRLQHWNVVPRLPWLWRTTRAHARTDLALPDAVRLAVTAASAGPGMFHGVVLKPPVVRSWRSPEGQSVLLLDRALLARTMDDLFDAPAPGIRDHSPCPDPDVAVNWRDRAREYRAKRGGLPVSSGADGGPDGEEDIDDLPEGPPDAAPSP
jgi:LCP family protein required for cell wall assembly